MNTGERINEILAKLPPDDADAIAAHLPPWLQRSRAADARDEALRAAASMLAPKGVAALAEALEQVLRRYRASAEWDHFRHLETLPEPVDPLRKLLHRVLRLGAGKHPGARQIANVITGRGRKGIRLRKKKPPEISKAL